MDKILNKILTDYQLKLNSKKIDVRKLTEKAYLNPEFKHADLEYRQAKLNTLTTATQESKKTLSLAEKSRNDIANKLGIDLQKLEINYDCPICKDTGIVKDGSICKCVYEKIKDVSLKDNNSKGFSFSFSDNKVKELKVKQSQSLDKIYKHMKAFCDKFPNTEFLNYLILGGVGVGKSSLLSAVANELISKNFTANFLTSFNMNKMFLDYHLSQGAVRSLNVFTSPDILIIDDLGSEQIFKKVTVEYLFCILDDRIRNNKHTIISSNLTLEQFEDIYTQRITSRMTAKNNSCLLYIDGEDLRKK